LLTTKGIAKNIGQFQLNTYQIENNQLTSQVL